MLPDEPDKLPEKDEMEVENPAQLTPQPIYFLPFDVQLQNAFSTEIVARRYPVPLTTTPVARLGLEDMQIDAEKLYGQVTLNVQIAFEEEPHPFDLSFKLLGQFSYTQNYTADDVRKFLEQGSLSILLPFARELLISLCNRLQVPPIMLAMVHLAPHPSMSVPEAEQPSE